MDYHEEMKTASVINFVTNKFPPTFISAGDKDPLLSQSKLLSNKLKSLDVFTKELFFQDSNLAHEYQFTIDKNGKLALNQALAFLNTFAK